MNWLPSIGSDLCPEALSDFETLLLFGHTWNLFSNPASPGSFIYTVHFSVISVSESLGQDKGIASLQQDQKIVVYYCVHLKTLGSS